MLWMLEQNPRLQRVAFCLDNDEPGVKATARLVEVLQEKGYSRIGTLTPEHKDWNEDLTGGPVPAKQEMTMTM